jgi:hypothetical protein
VVAASEVVDDNPLQKALQAHGHAEELQRQSAQHQATPTTERQVAAHIDGLPISEFKKQFLRQHPESLFEPLHRLMADHYQIARHAGVPDDTEAMNQAILDGLQRDLDHHRQLTAAHARPTPENALAHHEAVQVAEELQREAEGYVRSGQPDPPAALPAPRRSIPMSAPVSRDVPMASGGRTFPQITLNHDERQIAAISFPHLPRARAEYEYAQNKRKIAMKADGRIQGDR